MTQFRVNIPFRADLEDLVGQIMDRAPGTSGYDLGEVLIACDAFASALSLSSEVRLQVLRGADRSDDDPTRLWVYDTPEIGAEIDRLAERFDPHLEAYRTLHIDAAERDVPTILSVLAEL